MTPEQIASIETQLNASPEAAFLRARDEALKERDEARRKLDDLAERYKDLDAERERLRLELSAVSTPTAGVWFWQGAGDRPESLSCPVVMSAEKLRELLARNVAGLLASALKVADGDVVVLSPQEQMSESAYRAVNESFAAMKDLRRVVWILSPNGPLDVDLLTTEQRQQLLNELGLPAAVAKATEKGEAFKRYVHQRLDAAGVPADPEPDANAKHGCRIEGRLNYVLDEGRHALHERSRDIEALERVAAKLAESQAREAELRAAAGRALPFVHWDFPPRVNDATCGDGACGHPLSARELQAVLARPVDWSALRELLGRLAVRVAGYSGANPWRDVALTTAIDDVLRGER